MSDAEILSFLSHVSARMVFLVASIVTAGAVMVMVGFQALL